MFFGGRGFPFEGLDDDDDDMGGFPFGGMGGMGGGRRKAEPKEIDNKKLYEILGVEKDATME